MTTNQVSVEEFTFGEFSSEDNGHKVEAILKVLEESLDDKKTYQLFLKPTLNVQNIYSIHAMTDGTPITLPQAYNHDSANEDTTSVDPAFYTPSESFPEGAFPNSKYDSFLGFESSTPGQISSIGIDFASWNDSKAITITDGSVFSMNPDFDNIKYDENEIMISQLTLDEDQEIDITINIQGQSTITGVNLYQIDDITFKYDPKDKDDDEEYEFIKKIKDSWNDFKSFFEKY